MILPNMFKITIFAQVGPRGGAFSVGRKIVTFVLKRSVKLVLINPSKGPPMVVGQILARLTYKFALRRIRCGEDVAFLRVDLRDCTWCCNRMSQYVVQQLYERRAARAPKSGRARGNFCEGTRFVPDFCCHERRLTLYSRV